MSIESKIQQNIPLAPLTTFKIGGPAKFFIEVKTKDELLEALEWAKNNVFPPRHSLPPLASGGTVADRQPSQSSAERLRRSGKFFILAGGSNVLINDKGVGGLVMRINNDNMAIRSERLECGAGASLIGAARLSASHGLSGLEWAIGIPGTVGGAIRGNAGAYGSSISKSVETVEVFNIKKKKFKQFSNKECKFDYKESIFKKDNAKHLLIWQVVLKLRKDRIEKINSLLDKYLMHREKNQPKLPSAGCVFKNVDFANLRQMNAPAFAKAMAGKNLANEAEEAGIVKGGKVGAGWLIDKLDLKGKTIGGAKISLEHANFIVNTGKATAEDVAMLISFIKQQVRDKFGVQLQEEVQYLGF